MEQGKTLNRMNHLISEINAAYHDASLRLGISDSVCQILYTICNVGDRCLLSEICAQTGLSKQTINSALRKLEAEGAVFLEAVDGKAKMVCLTETGIAMARRTALRLIAVENEILASWPEEALQAYLAGMERFLEDLRKKIPEL